MSRQAVNRLGEYFRGSECLRRKSGTVPLTAKLLVTETKKNILGAEGPLEALGGGVGRCFVLLRFWVSVLLDGGIEAVLILVDSVPRWLG